MPSKFVFSQRLTWNLWSLEKHTSAGRLGDESRPPGCIAAHMHSTIPHQPVENPFQSLATHAPGQFHATQTRRAALERGKPGFSCMADTFSPWFFHRFSPPFPLRGSQAGRKATRCSAVTKRPFQLCHLMVSAPYFLDFWLWKGVRQAASGTCQLLVTSDAGA